MYFLRKLENRLLLVIFTANLLFGLPLFVFSQNAVRVVGPSGEGIYIPSEIEKTVPQKEVVKLLCYEAKWRGGEAITKMELLNKLLQPILEEVKELGVEIAPQRFLLPSNVAGQLNQKIEAVCKAVDLFDAKKRLREFVSFANDVRSDIEIKLASQLREAIEPALREKAEQLKKQIEQQLRDKAQKEAREIEQKLRTQAQKEADQIKSEIIERLKKQIDAQMRAEYKARMKPNGDNSALVAELIQKGRRLGERLGQQEAQKARNRLEEKYKKLAERERKKLEQKYKKLGNEIAGKERERIGKIALKFKNFGKEVQKSFQEINHYKYQEYKQMALEQKKKIILDVIDFYIDKAKQKIDSQKDLLEQAQKEMPNIASKYNIKSADYYKNQLEEDRRLIVQRLTASEITPGVIESTREMFMEKWEKIRQDLDRAKMIAQKDVIKMIQSKANWPQIKRKFEKLRDYIIKQKGKYQTDVWSCQKKFDCVKCPLLQKHKQLAEAEDELLQKINKAISLMEKIKKYSKTPPSIEKALVFKDDLQIALNDVLETKRRIFNYPNNVYDKYQKALRFRINYCSRKH